MALKTATGIMDSILMQAGNATDHLSDDDAKLPRSVIELVETSIYGSMDSSHGADESALGMAISQIEECNVDLTHRLGADGDLGALHKSVSEKQAELNRLRGEMDSANATRESEWERFSTHMTMIREPESCPALPSRTMPALDVFFEKSEYSVWFAAAQAEYVAHRDAFVAADDALKAAVAAYNLAKARRDTQYCDWKRELEQSCENFETCFSDRSKYYTDELTPRVQSDMASRIEAFKAGETLVQQIKFLLADSTTRETPEVDTSRFELGFPEVPPQRSCPLELLEDDKWVPTVTCADHKPKAPLSAGKFLLVNMKSGGVLTHANHGRGRGPIEIWPELNNSSSPQVQWEFRPVPGAAPNVFVVVNMKSNAALTHANHGKGRGPIQDWSELNDGSNPQAQWEVNEVSCSPTVHLEDHGCPSDGAGRYPPCDGDLACWAQHQRAHGRNFAVTWIGRCYGAATCDPRLAHRVTGAVAYNVECGVTEVCKPKSPSTGDAGYVDAFRR